MKSLVFFICSAFFISCADTRHTIKAKGSDTEVNLFVLLAETFHPGNKHVVTFRYLAGGQD